MAKNKNKWKQQEDVSEDNGADDDTSNTSVGDTSSSEEAPIAETKTEKRTFLKNSAINVRGISGIVQWRRQSRYKKMD